MDHVALMNNPDSSNGAFASVLDGSVRVWQTAISRKEEVSRDAAARKRKRTLMQMRDTRFGGVDGSDRSERLSSRHYLRK